jgi:spermidine synthase
LLTVAALVLAMLAWPGSGVLAIDTPSAHYTIEDATLSSGHTVRTLATGPGGKQSGIIVGSPSELTFWYTREIASLIDVQPAKQRIAVLGGGAYTLPAYLAQKYPESQIDAVEIDPKLLSIAQEYFEYSPAKNVGHIAMDARTFINGVKKPYDIVVVDVFGDDSIPESLMTAEYGRALKRAVTPGGVVIINAIAGTKGTCLELFQAVSRPYLDNFATGYYLPRINDGGRSNIAAVFGSRPNVPSNYTSIGPAVGPIYTDDYNPTMRVQFACERR